MLITKQLLAKSAAYNNPHTALDFDEQAELEKDAAILANAPSDEFDSHSSDIQEHYSLNTFNF